MKALGVLLTTVAWVLIAITLVGYGYAYLNGYQDGARAHWTWNLGLWGLLLMLVGAIPIMIARSRE